MPSRHPLTGTYLAFAFTALTAACNGGGGGGGGGSPMEEEKPDAPVVKKDAGGKDTKPQGQDTGGGGEDTAPPADVKPGTDAGADAGTDAGSDAAPVATLLDNPLAPMPASLKDTGIFPAFPDMTKVDPRAFAFAPRYPLWSNGLEKDRYAIIPTGKKIVSTKRDAWDFPVGTIFVKSFHHKNAADPTKPVYLETRIIRRIGTTGEVYEQWEFHVYEWDATNTTAKLADIKKRIPREVPANATIDNNAAKFTHNIPSLKDCWSCHVANAAPIIGFDELRLNWKVGTAQTLLQQVAAKGWLSDPLPATFTEITGRTPVEKSALEYLQANCAHCHRAPRGPEPGAGYAELDLRFDKTVAQTVNIETMVSSTATGIRVIPGDPAKSVLYRAMLAIDNPAADPEAKPMPTVGVDRADTVALKVISEWIKAIPPP